MEKKRVLIVTQEMKPYMDLSIISEIARKLPQYVQENGYEIRVLMPRFGNINERRHRLHEVVRLSGINIIIDDEDFPLIIKVASLPAAKMQVYFLDNDDFFRRKAYTDDADGVPFEDNAERMTFFSKGVLETVKKFGWPPDIIHCHGWMTSMIPMYLKTAYQDEPVFSKAKIVSSLYENSYEGALNENFHQKAKVTEDITDEVLVPYGKGNNELMTMGSAHYSDALIQGSETLPEHVAKMLESTEKPNLEFQSPEDYLSSYLDFYKTILGE